MRLSYQWLAELVDLDGVTPQALATMLTDAGLAVDAVEPRVSDISGVVVGQVVDCVQHPNADRLRVCTVDVGQPEQLTIVCGAPNVRAGMKVPVALVGATLPGGAIGKAKLRGIESMGMLCSAKEIGLETKWLPKEQTEGLYVLPEDTEIGADVVQLLYLDDVILDVDLTPNRSDCLSLRGFAYEVAALRGVHVKLGIPTASHGAGHSPASVRIDSPNCSRYEAQVLEDVGQGHRRSGCRCGCWHLASGRSRSLSISRTTSCWNGANRCTRSTSIRFKVDRLSFARLLPVNSWLPSTDRRAN